MGEQALKQLDAIIGTWQSDGETITDGTTPPVKITGTDAYEWLPGSKKYIIHRIDVHMGDDDVHAIEIIGGFNREKQTFAMHAFQSDGSTSQMWASKNADGSWLFASDTTRATLTLPKDGKTMSAKWEQKVDGMWRPWMNMRFTK